MKAISFVRRPWTNIGVALLLAALPAAAIAADTSFPFGHELILDVQPMKGSKRVPIIDIDDNGIATIDLWCTTVQGQLVVANDTITVVTGAKPDIECSPERAKSDDEILEALAQVTNWQREGDHVVLIGPTTLQFRIPTN